MKAKIAEVFESIQGEGIYMGERQIFVRFFGCNLTCRFCDTKLTGFVEYGPCDLLEKIKSYRDIYHSVSFTGGEPLMQGRFLKEILKLTYAEGYKNYLETNGTLPGKLKEVIRYVDIISMDVKLPSSTGLAGFWEAHRQFLKIASSKEVFLKAVICQSTQDSDLMETVKLIKDINPGVILILQPDSRERNFLFGEKLEGFLDICRREGINMCIAPQMHKLLGVK